VLHGAPLCADPTLEPGTAWQMMQRRLDTGSAKACRGNRPKQARTDGYKQLLRETVLMTMLINSIVAITYLHSKLSH
jgi:hypothetical protein